MSQKRDLDPAVALEAANDFLCKTSDLYTRAEIAGSLRRKKPVVQDIDFVVIPSTPNFSAWKEKLSERVAKIGGSVISFGEVISDFLHHASK